MSIGEHVWHKVFGQGVITEEKDDRLIIDFKYGIKKISYDAWLKQLFLSKEDYSQGLLDERIAVYAEYIDKKNMLLEKHNEKIKEVISKYIDKKDFLKEEFLSEEELRKILELETHPIDFKYDDVGYECRKLLIDLDDRQLRNIVIIINKFIDYKNKNYLLLVGIDVFTAKIVRIVDTNGAELGYHSYKENISKLPERTVIQAEFKIFDNKRDLNLLRIVSDFKILGKSNIFKLRKKYEQTVLKKDNFLFDFNEVFELCKFKQNKSFFALVDFKKSKLKLYKNKYQLKMDTVFVDVIDNKTKLEKKESLFYHGLAIISAILDSSGNIIIKAHRLLGKFYRLKSNYKDCEEYEYYDYNKYSLEEEKVEEYFEEIFEYYEERESVYEDYIGETLEEYSEYNNDTDFNYER